MKQQFLPPGIASLPEIDLAQDSYGHDIIEIEGVTSARNQGGWPGINKEYKVHCFNFAAWRRVGGVLIKRELTVLRPVPPDANYWNDFPKYSIQRIRVMLSADETRALFVNAMEVKSSDRELKAISESLQQPVVVSTERFGDLTLDRNYDWFETKSEWNGQVVNVTLPADNEQPSSDALKLAELIWSNQAQWNNQIESYAVKELLELKNDTWLQDGEPELTPEQFIETMTLTSVSVSADGAFEFWYNDGDLFCGHSIMVRGDLKNGPTEAGIHG